MGMERSWSQILGNTSKEHSVFRKGNKLQRTSDYAPIGPFSTNAQFNRAAHVDSALALLISELASQVDLQTIRFLSVSFPSYYAAR